MDKKGNLSTAVDKLPMIWWKTCEFLVNYLPHREGEFDVFQTIAVDEISDDCVLDECLRVESVCSNQKIEVDGGFTESREANSRLADEGDAEAFHGLLYNLYSDSFHLLQIASVADPYRDYDGGFR